MSELRDCGHEVFAVNPNVDRIDEETCHHTRPRGGAMLIALVLASVACAPPTADDPPETGVPTTSQATAGAAGRRVAPDVEYLSSPESEGLSLPFSEAVRVGDVLYLSGQVGNVPGELELVPGGIGPESRQTLENIRSALERYGSSLDRVVKCTVFLADIAEWPALNEVYREFFPDNPPARSALAASGLALDARVEIECIAVVGEASS